MKKADIEKVQKEMDGIRESITSGLNATLATCKKVSNENYGGEVLPLKVYKVILEQGYFKPSDPRVREICEKYNQGLAMLYTHAIENCMARQTEWLSIKYIENNINLLIVEYDKANEKQKDSLWQQSNK